MGTQSDKYAAGEQGLGYVYQIRFALAHLMKQDESQALLIEADDDVELRDIDGKKTLISLKHKQVGETVGTLSTDFWKSVRIWLDRYIRDGNLACDHSYCMATTARVGPNSLLKYFLDGAGAKPTDFSKQLVAELKSSKAALSAQIEATFSSLNETQQDDFLARIVIADSSLRIKELDEAFAPLLRSVAAKFRVDVRERMEGWWLREAIELIQGERKPITGAEVWAKFAQVNSEYYDERLPITFDDAYPDEEIDAVKDTRQFVEQLRAIGMSSDSLEMAILDFYRAFSQRAHWTRVNALVGGEIRKFELRLVEEWKRARGWAMVNAPQNEAEFQAAGRKLYDWAENQSKGLQIRKDVTEDFVRRGSFHILADEKPMPRVHWHPRFLERLMAATSKVSA
ncbi:TPA: ABC-three component system protein [Pseudomonas aeruginosa]